MTSTHSTLRQVVTFLILTFVLSAIYYYLIISAGSLSAGGGWYDLYIQGFFDPVTTDTSSTEWVVGEFGAGLSLVSLVVAYVFWRLRHRLSPEGLPDRT